MGFTHLIRGRNKAGKHILCEIRFGKESGIHQTGHQVEQRGDDGQREHHKEIGILPQPGKMKVWGKRSEYHRGPATNC